MASPKHRQLLRGADRGVAKSGGAPEVGPCRARLVKEIVAVPGRVEDDVIETEPVFELQDGRLRRIPGMPSQPFARHDIDIPRLLTEAG